MITTQTIECPYCGQMQTVMGEVSDPKELARMAAQKCTCDGALHASKAEHIVDAIEKLCKAECEEQGLPVLDDATVGAMKAIASVFADGEFESIIVQIERDDKMIFSRKKTDYTVKREYRIKGTA